MKILFIIQGEGRGHLTQAIALREKLLAEGHQLVGVLAGKSPSRQLPAFFTEKIGTEVTAFESPNFLPAAGNKQAHLMRSVTYNLFRMHKYMESICTINRLIRESQAEVVVNFYELLTGFTYLLFRPRAVMVCIAHQYLFLHPGFVFPETNSLQVSLLKLFTRLTALGATKKLALSFRKMPAVEADNLVVLPPLLRSEVLKATPQTGDYLHGYMLNSGFSEEVKEWHSHHPQVMMHFFWDKRDAPEVTEVNSRLFFHRLNDKSFINYMAGAKAYATTAGFESVCEAMYLGKPVLMVPTHIEQTCNAHDALLAGAGMMADSFDLDKLLYLAQHHEPNLHFRHWVKQADWLILHEFRRDILQANCTPTPWLGLPGKPGAKVISRIKEKVLNLSLFQK